MNDKELHAKVHSVSYNLMEATGIVTPVDVLMKIGILSKSDYENWRNGKVPYLEKVCKINLSKLQKINREIQAFAKKNDLKPSWTFYKQWGKNKKVNKDKAIQLRFSQNGIESIEREYATHYISPKKVDEAKMRCLLKKVNKETLIEN